MNCKKLLFYILIIQFTGAIGSFFTISSINSWYNLLVKPAFSPPNYIFAPVWIILYLMMAISVYFISEKSKENKEAVDILNLFWIHLFFNVAWSIIFFGFRNIFLAFIDIIIILIFIIILMIKSYKINNIVTWLLLPYLLWVSFASVLNYFILILNK